MKSRAAAAARRASPTACCAAFETTRRCAPEGASISRSPARPWTCWKWTRTASMRSTRRSCELFWRNTAEGRWASTPFPPRSTRRRTPLRKFTSRICCSSDFWTALRAGAWRPSARSITSRFRAGPAASKIPCSEMKIAYLSLGSNVGDRDKLLARTLERLASDDIRVVRVSNVYETEPRDVPDQPWFLNQVVEIETSLFPKQLLARLQKIEIGMGRVRMEARGPRTVDIDILFYGNAIVSTPGLEIPHPRLSDRRFVLEPLAELAPEFRHPRTRQTVREMLAAVRHQKVHRV